MTGVRGKRDTNGFNCSTTVALDLSVFYPAALTDVLGTVTGNKTEI